MTAPLRLPRRHKYGVAAKKDRTLDGIVFASKGEMKRYGELWLLKRAGKIHGLKRQVPFILHTAIQWIAPHGWVGVSPVGSYVADFTYEENGSLVVEDFKGMITPLARWKMKHFEAEYGIKIRLTGKRPSPRRAGRGG